MNGLNFSDPLVDNRFPSDKFHKERTTLRIRKLNAIVSLLSSYNRQKNTNTTHLHAE